MIASQYEQTYYFLTQITMITCITSSKYEFPFSITNIFVSADYFIAHEIIVVKVRFLAVRKRFKWVQDKLNPVPYSWRMLWAESFPTAGSCYLFPLSLAWPLL